MTRVNLSFAVDSPGDVPATTTLISVDATKNLPTQLTGDEPDPLTLVAKPGKAGYNSFFNNLERTIEVATKKIREEDQDMVVCVKPSDSQSEANDLGLAVALILLGKSKVADEYAAKVDELTLREPFHYSPPIR